MTEPSLHIEEEDGATTLHLFGRLVTDRLAEVESDFANAQTTSKTLRIDLSDIEALDTGGAWLVADLVARLEAKGVEVEYSKASAAHLQLIDVVAAARPTEKGIEDPARGLLPWLSRLGEKTAGVGASILSLMSFMGETLTVLVRTAVRPARWRPAALVTQMEEVGFNGIPIVVLMSFLIGVVLAFQGASQLRQFGAEIFVVDLIAISILRELGILLTAIIVAGRSGSAFTASIGSMKVREELDAMRTLGLDPMEVLVVPRVTALVIMLPILGFIANIAGLFGGALMSWVELGVSPGQFITRLQENTDVWHLGIGMIKAPIFAAIIGTVACWQAMQVRSSADSVGRHTTTSVVQSIFLVIAVDALFSVFFAELGL
ncbi:MlaE family lipid ABC transporter permease subunit [uncultured Tateyamaria sp.]|uniref:ABC transporter permease n=1 Tax=uncultured Tateyamaria sp. TaxID=455651 RepID=UPI00263341D5|nr:MlaE family lipid ABC transporter permease subunit [uncultured Tateyamaria sp.]